MMINKKKVAALIVKGLADYSPDAASKYMDKEQGVKEHKEESGDSKMGYEMAMADFIAAVKDGDVKAACKAMMEFNEMSDGMEYYKDSMGDSSNTHGDKGEY